MVDLPTTQYPVTTTKQIQPGVSPSEIAQPYTELSNTLKAGGEATETISKSLAEQAGAQAVTRDENGEIQIQKMPFIGPAAQVYEHSAKMAAAMEYESEASKKMVDMRIAHENDPQGFLTEAASYTRNLQKKVAAVAGADVANTVFRTTDSTATQTYSGLSTTKQEVDRKTEEQTAKATQVDALNNLGNLARGGEITGDAVNAQLDRFKAAQALRASNPANLYTQGEQDYDLQQMKESLTGNYLVHNTLEAKKNAPNQDDSYKNAVEQANKIYDKSVLMSPANKDKYFHIMMGEIRTDEAIRQRDIEGIRALQKEYVASVKDQITSGDTEVLKSIRDGYVKLGAWKDVAALDSIVGHLPLRDAFSKQPLADRVQQLSHINGAAPYVGMIQDAAKQYGVDAELLTRQIQQESGFRNLGPNAKQAAGISQFIPSTAKQYGVDVTDPKSSIQGQAHYMQDLLTKFGGNTGLALAGYNWGDENVRKWMAAGSNPDRLPAETQDYVRKITGHDIRDYLRTDMAAAPSFSLRNTIGNENLEGANKAMNLTPQERQLYERHLRNLTGPGGVDNPPTPDNPQGSRSSLFVNTFEIEGKTYVIPSVWEGKILPPEQSLARAKQEGLDHFPSYGSEDEAQQRYGQMHDFMEKDTQKFRELREQQRKAGPTLPAPAGGGGGAGGFQIPTAPPRGGVGAGGGAAAQPRGPQITPLAKGGPGMAAFVDASRRRDVETDAKKEWRQITEDLAKGIAEGNAAMPSDEKMKTLMDAFRLSGDTDSLRKVEVQYNAITNAMNASRMPFADQHAIASGLKQDIANSDGPLGAEQESKLLNATHNALVKGANENPQETIARTWPDTVKQPLPLTQTDQAQLNANIQQRYRNAQMAQQAWQRPEGPMSVIDKGEAGSIAQQPDPKQAARILTAVNTLPTDSFIATMSTDYMRDALTGMVRSYDPDKLTAAMQTMDRFYREDRIGFTKTYHDSLERLQMWQAWKDLGDGPAAMVERFKRADDPGQQKARDDLKKQADKEIEKMTPDTVAGNLGTAWVSWIGRNITGTETPPSSDALQASRLKVEYESSYRDFRERGLDAEQAQKKASEKVLTVWGPTAAGGGQLMRYPPERYYPQVDGSHDWLKKDIQDLIDTTMGQTSPAGMLKPSESVAGVPLFSEELGATPAMVKRYSLKAMVSDPRTEADINNKRPANYQFIITDRLTGQDEVMHDAKGSSYFSFDPSQYIKESEARNAAARVKYKGEAARETEFFATHRGPPQETGLGPTPRGPPPASFTNPSEPSTTGAP